MGNLLRTYLGQGESLTFLFHDFTLTHAFMHLYAPSRTSRSFNLAAFFFSHVSYPVSYPAPYPSTFY